MPRPLSRRAFLAASAAAALVPALARAASAGAPLQLSAETRTLDIGGKAASVFGLAGPGGRQCLMLDPGERFRVSLTNRLAEETLIHWHGQIPPHAQDGVPGMPMPALQPGEARDYDFAARPGTHWMHSHIPLQEMRLLAAPLIVRTADDLSADRQEVTLFLHDFTFRHPEEVLMGLAGAGGHAMNRGAHDMSAMAEGGDGMAGMAMDLNDIEFDAYLANDRTLDDPEVVEVGPGARIRLRVINGSAATVFWVDTGAVPAEIVAADGEAVRPVPGTRFGLAMAQRLDLDLTIPGTGAFPILALREGARERTGIVLATPGAGIARIPGLADEPAPAFDRDLAQELTLAALNQLADAGAASSRTVMLQGSMQPYLWMLDGRVWPDHDPVLVRAGERLHLSFHNMSMMGHPMHLHGHAFQVIDLNGRQVRGAVRDTLYLPPMATATVAVTGGEAADWMLHCHHMAHLASGMMTVFSVRA
ncbi:MAG: multicopper oxidase family protein [Paracoccaceae bacterium]